MKKIWNRIPWTTTGRFWGYNGVLIALSVSLAGNIAAAYLDNEHPSWVELSFAGIPPLAAFLSIEIVNHNPWADEEWGPWVRRIMLGVVAPASAIVSFIHLVSVVMHDRKADASPEGILNWVTAVLTALLIDGMMFGGVAALLIKVKKKALETIAEVVEPVAAIAAYPDFRAEIAAAGAEQQAALSAIIEQQSAMIAELLAQIPATKPTKPRVKASLAKQTAPAKERTRFPAGEHPLWEEWLKASTSGQPWNAERVQKEIKTVMGKDVSAVAAEGLIRRFTGHAKTLQNA